MAKRNHVYSVEELTAYGLHDTAPRNISTKHKVDVHCNKCAVLGNVLFREVEIRGEWLCKSCGLSGIKKDYKNGKPLLVRKWTSEELEARGLQDTTSRPIKAGARVKVYCFTCKAPGEAVLNNINASIREKGYPWRCPECFAQSQSTFTSSRELLGPNNPFFGKKHSPKTCTQISQLQSERQAMLSPSERKAAGNRLTEAFIARHGTANPMDVPAFVQKHKEAHAEWFENRDDATRFSSKGELELKAWVESLGLFTEKYRTDGTELDIFVPKLSIGLEYNGLYWHSEKHKHNQYHINKTTLFKKQGIRVLHVFEHEWRDRKEQVQSFLISVLGLNTRKIGARKCSFEIITREAAGEFLDNYHIQGSSRRCIYTLGALLGGELVAVCTFARHQRTSTSIVLDRFCCKTGIVVQGALSKFSKLAVAHFKEGILSWADRRYSEAKGYLAAGWSVDAILPPDYFYTDGQSVFSKQSRRKSAVNTPDSMTEARHAAEDGLYRVWDCGKIRLKFTSNPLK